MDFDGCGIRLEAPQLGVNVQYICECGSIQHRRLSGLYRHFPDPCTSQLSYKRPTPVYLACYSASLRRLAPATSPYKSNGRKRPCKPRQLGPTFCSPRVHFPNCVSSESHLQWLHLRLYETQILMRAKRMRAN